MTLRSMGTGMAAGLLGMVSSAVLAALSLPVTAGADEVLPVRASLSASTQDDVNGRPKIGRHKVTEKEIINLALGQPIDNPVAANVILAAVTDCSERFGQLVVFDTGTASVLRNVATLVDDPELVGDVKKAEGIVELQIVQTPGMPANGLDGGFLVLAIKFSIPTGGECPKKIQASVMGLIDLHVTDDLGLDSITALVPKGRMSTGASLGTAP